MTFDFDFSKMAPDTLKQLYAEIEGDQSLYIEIAFVPDEMRLFLAKYFQTSK